MTTGMHTKRPPTQGVRGFWGFLWPFPNPNVFLILRGVFLGLRVPKEPPKPPNPIGDRADRATSAPLRSCLPAHAARASPLWTVDAARAPLRSATASTLALRVAPARDGDPPRSATATP